MKDSGRYPIPFEHWVRSAPTKDCVQGSNYTFANSGVVYWGRLQQGHSEFEKKGLTVVTDTYATITLKASPYVTISSLDNLVDAVYGNTWIVKSQAPGELMSDEIILEVYTRNET